MRRRVWALTAAPSSRLSPSLPCAFSLEEDVFLILGLRVISVWRMWPHLYFSAFSDWRVPGHGPHVLSLEPTKGSLLFPYIPPYIPPNGHGGCGWGWGLSMALTY